MCGVKADANADADAAVEYPSTMWNINNIGEAVCSSMAASHTSQFALCVVCERNLDLGRYVLYEIGRMSLTQHLSCFSRGVIHGYRVLNPTSPPVVVTVAPCLMVR